MGIPENVLLYDDETESGFAGTVYWGVEVIRDHVALFPDNDDLIESVALDFKDVDICDKNYGQTQADEDMLIAWEEFCDIVKHEARLFVREKPLGEEDNVGGELRGQQFLEKIVQFVSMGEYLTCQRSHGHTHEH